MLDLPELDLLHAAGEAGSLIRIPPSDSIPLSSRVRRVLDTSPLRRLAGISQLGMVSLVYPGATHSRLEHTLGVYHKALRFISRIRSLETVASWLDEPMTDAFVLAALLHDVGHWPFCHPIEDMQLEGLAEHESRVAEVVQNSELEGLIANDWRCDVADVLSLLDGETANRSPGWGFLGSCLSGPIDIDKLDYLQRDSLHAGVPYGRNFDENRLISSLTVDPETNRLAIGEKGRTAAEMMVFARYVMFSEVYWHHAVRSATAMLQRSLFLLANRWDLSATLRLDDATWIQRLRRTAEGSLAEPLVDGLFGSRRRLFKRAAEFSSLAGKEIHHRLSRQPYWWLVALSESLAEQIAERTGVAVGAADVLIDAPPVELEVDINMTVVGRDCVAATLGDVSPVAAALAHRQFDHHVKRVRVFLRPDLRDTLKSHFATKEQWSELLVETIDAAERSWA
ncbi:MAG: HD domain-containing protein [Planctomycetota bacterium]